MLAVSVLKLTRVSTRFSNKTTPLKKGRYISDI